MKRKSVFYLLLLFFTPVIFYSCVDLNVEKQYVADAYIASKIVDGDTIYAVASYVNSTALMTDVRMKNPDGSNEVKLKELTASYYEYAGNENTYSKQKPPTGNYSFSITFDDDSTIVVVDNLTSEVAKPVSIKKAVPDSTGGSVVVEWKKSKDVNYYMINMMKNNILVYSSGYLDTIYSAATIYTYSGGWASNSNPHNGDSLEVVVSGVTIDKTSTQFTHLQSISQSVKLPFVWVE